MTFNFINEDCVKAMKAMPAASVDVFVTSPDYNLGVNYRGTTYKRKLDQYLKWVVTWATEIKRVMKPGGHFFLNISGAPSRPLLPHYVAIRLSDLFQLQNTIHWIKSITVTTPGGDIISVGHFKPLTSARYVNDLHEYVFHFTNEGEAPIDRLALGVPYADKTNVKRWAATGGKDKRCRGNTWHVPYKTIKNRNAQRPHPATFPTELVMNCLKLAKVGPESVVCDPFCGIGHSAEASQLMNVKEYIGIDTEAYYLDEARKRVAD